VVPPQPSPSDGGKKFKKRKFPHLVVTSVLSEETRQEKNLYFRQPNGRHNKPVDVRAALLGQNNTLVHYNPVRITRFQYCNAQA